MDIVQAFKARRSGDGWMATCPSHSDGTASLKIDRGNDGRWLLYCHAGCTTENVVSAAGITMADLQPEVAARRIVERYSYVDVNGRELFQAVRWEPKDFSQRHKDPVTGAWVWNLQGVERVIYRIDRLQGKEAAFVAEGEKDVDRLWSLGLPATCNPLGGGKWKDEYSGQLAAAGVKRVAIVPDADDAGRLHAEQVAASCRNAGLETRIIVLPGLEPKQDVSDWLTTNSKGDFLDLVQAAFAAPPQDPIFPTNVAVSDAIAAGDPAVEIEVIRERARRTAKRRLDAEERPAIVWPEMLTLRERLARPRAPRAHRIAGWQPRNSRVMVVAQYKSGKTTIVNNYARSVLDGEPFLGCALVLPLTGTLAIVDTEMDPDQLDDWMADQRIVRDDRVVPIPLRGQVRTFNLLDDDIRRQWAVRLRDLGVELLILDCLRPVLDALGLNENNEAGRFLTAFDALLHDAGISEAMVVQHMGHTNERARGDSRLRDWPDVEWRLTRKAGTDGKEDPRAQRFISAYGRDVDIHEAALSYNGQTRRLTLVGGSRRDAEHGDVLDAILDVLDDMPPLPSGSAIKDALERSGGPRFHAVDKALKFGERTGRLVIQPGPKNAKLYRRASELPPASGQLPPEPLSVLPAAYREPETRKQETPNDSRFDGVPT